MSMGFKSERRVFFSGIFNIYS